MKATRGFTLLALAVGFCTSVALHAAPDGGALAVALGPKSTLWLEGTSTMHDYQSTAGEIRLAMTADSALAGPADAAGLEALIRDSGVRRVDVEVPVLSLHSKKSGLDKNLWKTLKSAEYPVIRCQLSRYSVAPAKGSADTLELRAEGTLEVAGRSRPVTLDARAWRAPSGLWIEGSQPLLMSDFGIKPPTMMMGTLRVADRVTVHYRLLLMPKDADGGSAPAADPQKGAVR